MKFQKNIIEFSGGDTALYEKFVDYWKHYRNINHGTKFEFDASKSFDEKESLMNAAFKREIMKIAGIQNFDAFPIEAYATNPLLNWATFAVVSTMIDAILPDVMIQSTGLYADVRTVGWGENAIFNVESRDLFTVSKSGLSQKTTEAYKQFKGQLTIQPEMHEITVMTSLMNILRGTESLAAFTAKALKSIEAQMLVDTYACFAAGMNALDNAGDDALRFAGYTQAALIGLCQKVEAWNGGQKPMIVGTKLALANVLPADANYKYSLDSEFVKLGFIREFSGYELFEIQQTANWKTPFLLNIANDRLWVVSPSSQKLVKIVLEGSTLSNTTGTFENANLTSTTTLWKSFGMGIATNSVAGVIEL